uniref:B3 domain-containing protein REM20-like n=1 Tax=Erigeron canadensis TaxID=72917 RepID=UPI001CB9CE65|nr:B3 domain-containing protein REM20-like [Erigeron canadensis]
MVSRRPPSFFRMLLDPSAPYLPLPSDFVCMHLKNKMPKGPIVFQCANGCHFWRLKIEKIGENYCFTDGWSNVVQDKHLGFGDFLVIWYANRSTFKMLVYSPNGCEKIMPQKEPVVPPTEHVVPPKEHQSGDDGNGDDCGGDVIEHFDDAGNGDDDDDDDDDYDESDDVGDGDPSFVAIMGKTHERTLRLPAHFSGLPGIDAMEGIVIVKNLQEKEWPMGLRLDRSFQSERYMLSSGWSKFYRTNNLSLGDKCVFKFIRSQGKILLAKVTKKKWSRRPPESSDEGETLMISDDVDVASEDEYVKVVKRPRLMPYHDSNFVYF